MSTRYTRDLPGRLEGVRRRFERWRGTHEARSRIPEELWASAVEMAGTYGICRTAKVLRVAYYALKKRVGQDSPADHRGSTPTMQVWSPNGVRSLPAGSAEGGAVATFLELAPPAQAGAGECLLEMEDASGAKMRVHLKGFAAPDLAALSRSFWNPGP